MALPTAPIVPRPLDLDALVLKAGGHSSFEEGACLLERVEWPTARPSCVIDGCDGDRHGGGLCGKHYRRKLLYGDPLIVKRIRGNPIERFWSAVNKNGPIPEHHPGLGPCWLWLRAPSSAGYGTLSVEGKTVKAHRFSYSLVLGPIPDDLELDHLCRVRLCVRTQHLEPVTNLENIRRGLAGKVNHRNSVKTHCDKGHPFDETNTSLYKGRRYCRTCHRDNVRSSSQRRQQS